MNRDIVLKLYVAFIGCLTALVVAGAAIGVTRLPQESLPGWLGLAALLALLSTLSSLRLVHALQSGSWAMGTTFHTVAIILLPFPLMVLTIFISKCVAELWLIFEGRERRRSARAFVINVGATTLAVVGAGLAFRALNGDYWLWSSGFDVFKAFPALVALILCYQLINVMIIVGAITLTTREMPWTVLAHFARGTFLPETSLILVGVVFAALWHESPVLSLLIVVPVFLSLRAFEAVDMLRRQTVEAVLKMAESIDYRDTGTYEHSKRIAELTERLATKAGLQQEHTAEIVLASRVHDLGKIGISNEILLKSGPLTPAEQEIMSHHPEIGATILQSYTAFEGAVDIVRYHHERWDGSGYPQGLKGEEIPIGARILSVVDAFDAMTADRPYRRGAPVDEAVEMLKRGIGSQFDPTVCALFIQTLIDDGVYTPPVFTRELRVVPPESGYDATG